MTDRRKALAVAAVVGAAMIWSTSFAVTKVLLDAVPPLTIGALRFTVAALLLAVAVRAQSGWRPPSRRSIAGMGLSGLLGITVYFALENIGVDLATASDATLIIASYPIITLILEAVLRQARVTVLRVVGMLLAVLGVWMVVRQGAEVSGSHRLLGDLILLAGGLVWASYNIAASRSGKGHTALTVTYYQTCAGAAGFLLLALLEHDRWGPISPVDLAALGYLAAFCSVTAFLLYNLGLKTIPSATAVNILNLVPVFGLVAAVVVAGESITWAQIVGGGVVIAGVVLSLTNIDKDVGGTGGSSDDDRYGPGQVRRGSRPDAAAGAGGERGERDHHDVGAPG